MPPRFGMIVALLRALDSFVHPTPMKPTKILIVEDERHITKFLEFILTREGFEISSAGDGKQALETLGKFNPDCILLDLGLPDMRGIDLLAEIRANADYRNIKVIVLSATLYEGISEQLSEAGADAQCSKPIAPSTLVRMLRNLNLMPSAAN